MYSLALISLFVFAIPLSFLRPYIAFVCISRAGVHRSRNHTCCVYHRKVGLRRSIARHLHQHTPNYWSEIAHIYRDERHYKRRQFYPTHGHVVCALPQPSQTTVPGFFPEISGPGV